MTKGQTDLFFNKSGAKTRPLADKLRPESRDKFVGFSDLARKYPFLQGKFLPSMILTGPSGSGKTTLARILGKELKKEIFDFNAVLGGVAELRKIAKEAQNYVAPIVFIDEIHRFNKAQQDALLPHVENGDFVLIGATTENPKSYINRALLSRAQIVEIEPISKDKLENIIQAALEDIHWNLSQEIKEIIAICSEFDARKALNILETLFKEKEEFGTVPSIESIKDRFLSNSRLYDKSDDRHYDVISAFIKSMRGSDPDNALLWLAVMLDGGEDPMFIARRMVIFASEDVGNADPRAITMASSIMEAVSKIGMPEARIILGQGVTYLASTVKSNASYRAIDSALDFVRSSSNLEVPNHLKNLHPDKKNYIYPHSHPNGFIKQFYGPGKEEGNFYRPKESGQEKYLRERLQELWGKF